MRFLIAAILAALVGTASARAAETVTLAAADGVTVYGEASPSKGPAKGTILLFHQAGSNRAEYAPIAPKLTALGYNTLAIDQRSGGTRWGHANQTVGALRREADFLDALPDLEAALAFARQKWPGTPVIAWGSSYSASLVFLLAARHQGEVSAILSFSPGEYFPGKSIRDAAAMVHCPVFVTSASTPGEEAAARILLEAVPNQHKTQFLPAHGIHGSSTLREDSNPGGAAQAWSAVSDFLVSVPMASTNAR